MSDDQKIAIIAKDATTFPARARVADVKFLLAVIDRQSKALKAVEELAYAIPGRHADAPCRDECVVTITREIHEALAPALVRLPAENRKATGDSE